MTPDRSPAPSTFHLYRTRRRLTRPGALALAAAVVVVVAVALAALASGRGDRLSTTADASGAIGPQDGYVAVGESLSPISTEPAVAKLNPALLDAVRRAATDARAAGIVMRINSGWRSVRYQEALLRRAVRKYGSLAAARQYVKPPSESSHVTGHAVDIGPTDADSWLQQHGSAYGLCQIYANEMWHYELATRPGGTCPPMSMDAASG